MSDENDFICLKPKDIDFANSILLNVLNSLNNKEKQRGGGDKFDILASLLIAGSVSAGTFGVVWASGWIISIISSAANVSEIFEKNIYEVCISKHNLSTLVGLLKGEVGKIIKTHMSSKNVHHMLASYLRKKFETYDNFIEICFSD
jgi:uncharacterized protein YqgC (DUF456 family)